MGGKAPVPTSQFKRALTAARLAADATDLPTLAVARTDALDAILLTSDIDPQDRGKSLSQPWLVARTNAPILTFSRIMGKGFVLSPFTGDS